MKDDPVVPKVKPTLARPVPSVMLDAAAGTAFPDVVVQLIVRPIAGVPSAARASTTIGVGETPPDGPLTAYAEIKVKLPALTPVKCMSDCSPL